MNDDPALEPAERRTLAQARRAVLATIAADGRPRLVPICFVLDPEAAVIHTPLDEKPKAVADVRELARVRDVGRDPRVTILVDTWDEDWSRLGWLRCEGTASLLEPGGESEGEHRSAAAALRARYPQYAAHDLASRPMLRIQITRATGWSASGGEPR